MSEQWARWENQTVNGTFPLRRQVRASDHSAVFLTEHRTQAIPDAALKLVPAIPTFKGSQLAHWSVASRLSHPCLVRLLDTGTCQLEGLQFLFVVTEYAEQTLAQVLAQRALDPEELRKLIRPVLEALSFLHRKKLVHGALKPSNLLIVKERLKLASDAVRPAGESAASLAPASIFDPPESKDGSFSTAGDVWSLGVLMVEALTRKLPVWQESSRAIILPESLPPDFLGIVRKCLSRNPAKRPTVEELDAQINPMPAIYQLSSAHAQRLCPTINFLSPPVVLQALPVRYPDPEPDPYAQTVVLAEPLKVVKPRTIAEPWIVPPPLAAAEQPMMVTEPVIIAAAHAQCEPVVHINPERRAPPGPATNRAAFLARAAMIVTGVVAAGWLGAFLLGSQQQPPSAPRPPIATTVPVAAPIPEPALPQATEAPDPRSTVREELPDVPDSALATIHGRMLFAVRVSVDPAGRVVHATAVGSRSSEYFSRLSLEAAMRWKFAPADTIAIRKWLLHFQFTRAGVTVHAA